MLCYRIERTVKPYRSAAHAATGCGRVLFNVYIKNPCAEGASDGIVSSDVPPLEVATLQRLDQKLGGREVCSDRDVVDVAQTNDGVHLRLLCLYM